MRCSELLRAVAELVSLGNKTMNRLSLLLVAILLTAGCNTSLPPSQAIALAKAGIAENRPFKWNVNEGMLGIRFGMHSQEVVKLLGKPSERFSSSVQSHAWQYHKLGIAISFDEQDRVLSFIAGDGGSDPDAWLTKAFKGATEKGIEMGSTEEEVTRAYGSPSSRQAGPAGVRLLYSHPGQRLVFNLRDGKVFHLTAVKKLSTIAQP